MPNEATVAIARDVREAIAGRALTERQAKLYSQRLRLDMGQAGLASFTPGDVDLYLDEAMFLIECALLEGQADPGGPWRQGIKRAAEILEWLSQPSLKPPGAPLHLLSAAAYQLAGYPAMALGLLRRMRADEPFSTLLQAFLKSDFPAALDETRKFWRDQRSLETAGRIDPTDLTTHTIRHVVMCMGTVCEYVRSGNDVVADRAVTKLKNLAAGLLHSRDQYSYFLARLTAEACRRFVETCLWPHIGSLRGTSSRAASDALVHFARSAFVNGRSLVWPAQAAGIERLHGNTSFVLCTPTGSGKTTIATVATIQALFSDPPDGRFDFAALGLGSLVLYLVPSRALAAEVEARLSQDLRRIAAQPITVTGLYGGVDWGPTDAWIQNDQPTIVICTFEKADALIRYLGVLFLSRVRLVVVDEAHMVEQDESRLSDLQDGTSRAFRLEQLGTRLLRARDEHGFRVLALSAVATRAAPALARWIEGREDASPTTSSYRSTRQMLGRLEVSATGQFVIRYDLMDGRSLSFNDERGADKPFVPGPFPRLPEGIDPNAGPEGAMKAPTFWAALQLAAERPDGSRPSVLISLTQNVDAFARTCADLIEIWPEGVLPRFHAVDEANDIWVRCLASVEDVFTVDSAEYRLLRRGIAVHHGKMPGLLARRLKGLIDRGYVRVIIATSTLSEGVNIPVNFLLIPNVYRGQSVISLQEFTNLIGRVGRPGVGTEGSALVVLPVRAATRGQPITSRQWDGYGRLVTGIQGTTGAAGMGAPEDRGSSPLLHLLGTLETAWSQLTGGGTPREFEAWLEQTAIVDTPDQNGPAYDFLDSLDGFLIAAIQEIEELRHADLSPDQIEAELAAIWRRTYAFAAAGEEDRLVRIWLARGCAIKAHYPHTDQRRRIYKSSLSPRSAVTLLGLAESIHTRLAEGASYARWPTEERFRFVRDVIALLAQIPPFRISTTLGRQKDFQNWPILLRWWLAKDTLRERPEPAKITTWFEFVAQNFIYRSTWGLGSIIGILLDTADDNQPIRALEIGDWPRSGLPWIAFWMKELITWGTLDPVAAFLLARGDAVDRPSAEAEALAYHQQLPDGSDPNDSLDPRKVRDWVGVRRVRTEEPVPIRQFEIEVGLARPPADYLRSRLTVAPIDDGNSLTWIDPGGYVVAHSERPRDWVDAPSDFEFQLEISRSAIVGKPYLRYG